MKKFLYLMLFMTVLNLCSEAKDQNDLLHFYSIADSLTEYPEINKPLVVICHKKIDKLWVSLIGYKGEKKIFIAAITNEKIQNANKEIYRILDFYEGNPVLGKVTTWGYIYDRNKDGKVDYMSLVDGAAPFLDDRVPESYPVRGQKLNKLDLEMYVNKCKIIFNHWSDDNYDENIDGVVHVDVDPLRDWVKRKIFARCTKFNNIFDDVWSFKKKISSEREKIDFTGIKIPYRPFGKISDFITKQNLQYQTNVLSLINRGIKMCEAEKIIYSGN